MNLTLPFEHLRTDEIRTSKKARIKRFFFENIGEHFTSAELHERFGTAFRSRSSEINRERDCSFIIRNKTWEQGGREHSIYWSEWK